MATAGRACRHSAEQRVSLVGASLEVMDRDSKRMRGERPYLFTNIKAGQGVEEVARFIAERGGLAS